MTLNEFILVYMIITGIGIILYLTLEALAWYYEVYNDR